MFTDLDTNTRQQSGLPTLTERKTINYITIIPYFFTVADSAVFIIVLLQFLLALNYAHSAYSATVMTS